MKPPSALHRAVARIVRASSLVDRGFNFFDRMRSRAVVRFGTDRFFTAYNDVTYGDQDRYRPDREAFKPELYEWERRVTKRTFPEPPARILIGGVGGGREALALARMGYAAVAFDRSAELIGTLIAAIPSSAQIEALIGDYQDLPVLRRPDGRAPVDLSTGKTFDAAICGWGSFSHLPIADRVPVLRSMAALTTGPIMVSFLPRPAGKSEAAVRPATFSVHIGLYRELSVDEMRELGRAAGLELVPLEDDQESAVVVFRRITS